MPVYNGETYLEESIKANLAQTFEDFTLIIADNASTDRTREICLDYASKDERISYLRNPENLGASQNYTRCFEPANCTYFRWSNGDDLLEPQLVERCVEVLDTHPDVVLAYGKTKIIDGDGQLSDHYDDRLNLPQESAIERFRCARASIGLSNVLYGLMRREQLAQTELLGNYIASDINLILELTLYGKFLEVQEPLFSRRMHEDASSWDRSDNDVQREFWDPSKKKMGFSYTRGQYELLRAIRRSPIKPQEKRSLYGFVLKKTYWSKERVWAEIKEHFSG